MNKLYDIITLIRDTSSTNEKQKILEENEFNIDLKNFFKYCLLPNMKYGIKKIPEYTNSSVSNSIFMKEALELLENLHHRVFTGNLAKEKVHEFMCKNTEEENYIFSCMIQKNPRCGASVAIINRIWDNLIPLNVKLNKAMSYSNKNMKAIKYPAISQRKCDGARCLAIMHNNELKMVSSGDIEYYKLNEYFYNDVKNFGNDIILDGELLIIENDNTASRKKGNGILNKVLKKTAIHEELDKVHMVIWDCIPYEEYLNDAPSKKYIDTFNEIKEIEKNNKLSKISVVESKLVNGKKEAILHFKEMLMRGEEGTIIKNCDHMWEGDRSKDCVKLKIVIQVTMEITGMYEGNEKYTGMLGGFICKSSDGIVEVNVGSGLKDSDRKEFWKDDLIGKFLEVETNGIIVTDDGKYSLFLPRFKMLRPDKTEADSFETIKALSDGSEMLMEY